MSIAILVVIVVILLGVFISYNLSKNLSMQQKDSFIIKWALIGGIVILLNLFINYSASLVFPEPEYNDFCGDRSGTAKDLDTGNPIILETEDGCLAVGGSWTRYPADSKLLTVDGKPAYEGYCNETYSCQKKFEAAGEDHNQKMFVSLIVIGIILLIAGAFTFSYHIVPIALILSAVLDFLFASLVYWSRANELLKVLLLGVALIAVFWVVLKKFNHKEENMAEKKEEKEGEKEVEKTEEKKEEN